MSYWRDLASRIMQNLKEHAKDFFIGIGIATLAAGQIILCAILFGWWLNPDNVSFTFASFLGVIAGVLLLVLEFLLWVDYEEWKKNQKGKQPKQETTTECDQKDNCSEYRETKEAPCHSNFAECIHHKFLTKKQETSK
jgi:hypothetical protein